MVFTSSLFLFVFLPLVLFSYYVINQRFYNLLLLLFSLLFYAWGEPKYIVLIIASIIVNYVMALLISRTVNHVIKLIFLLLAVCFNLGLLFYFKYFDFVTNSINAIFHTSFKLRNIALPIGISFYTFQSLSYVVDVFKEKVSAQKSIIKLGLYISFFPQLIAGPIVRYTDIARQLDNRKITGSDFYAGCKCFMIGFSKKVLLADTLAPLVDAVFAENGFSALAGWTGVLAYALQIFFDFSGYSDMAIGLGKIFGFAFPENFNYPYISSSIREFWRRWHISLSNWFKDYVYIPLGGNRAGKNRTYLNLFIVFLLTGIWHGASWNFIFWGVYYAFFLIIERLFLGKILEKLPIFVLHIYAIIVVLVGWIFFRATGMKSAIAYVLNLFNFNNVWKDFASLINRQYVLFIFVGIIFSLPIGRIADGKLNEKGLGFISDLFIIVCFFIAICYLLGSGFSPFLYFRF